MLVYSCARWTWVNPHKWEISICVLAWSKIFMCTLMCIALQIQLNKWTPHLCERIWSDQLKSRFSCLATQVRWNFQATKHLIDLSLYLLYASTKCRKVDQFNIDALSSLRVWGLFWTWHSTSIAMSPPGSTDLHSLKILSGAKDSRVCFIGLSHPEGGLRSWTVRWCVNSHSSLINKA